MSIARWPLPTRFLHLGLAAAVTAQLFVSLVMEPPADQKAGEAMAAFAYEIHETVGLFALAVVLLHWLWSLAQTGEGNWRHLLPWGAQGRREVMADLRGLAQQRLPEGGPRGGLPGLVHGLGLLAVTAMALSGGLLFLYLPEHGEPHGWVEIVEEFHETIAALVWTYWGAHIAMGVLHQLTSPDYNVRDMFKLTR
jgi:cytochrome b561